jgi:hypothetical protein
MLTDMVKVTNMPAQPDRSREHGDGIGCETEIQLWMAELPAGNNRTER